jgi:hypothetical protein
MRRKEEIEFKITLRYEMDIILVDAKASEVARRPEGRETSCVAFHLLS